MFGKSKRPWKKYAWIERVEHNDGDVKFRAWHFDRYEKRADRTVNVWSEFESLTEAEAHLAAWWDEWWPRQVKKSSRA